MEGFWNCWHVLPSVTYFQIDGFISWYNSSDWRQSESFYKPFYPLRYEEIILCTTSSLSQDDEREIRERTREMEGLHLFGIIYLERSQNFMKK